MTEVDLCFKVMINLEEIDGVDDLGKELAIFLAESFFNGEDVLEVEYTGHSKI